MVGRLFHMKCLTCLRGGSGGRLLACGLQLVWSEQVGGGSGSDLGGAVSHLTQISVSDVIWVGHIEHRTARSDTPCKGKTTVHLHGRSCSLCDEHGCLSGAVSSVVGPCPGRCTNIG